MLYEALLIIFYEDGFAKPNYGTFLVLFCPRKVAAPNQVPRVLNKHVSIVRQISGLSILLLLRQQIKVHDYLSAVVDILEVVLDPETEKVIITVSRQLSTY